MISHS